MWELVILPAIANEIVQEFSNPKKYSHATFALIVTAFTHGVPHILFYFLHNFENFRNACGFSFVPGNTLYTYKQNTTYVGCVYILSLFFVFFVLFLSSFIKNKTKTKTIAFFFLSSYVYLDVPCFFCHLFVATQDNCPYFFMVGLLWLFKPCVTTC